MGHKAADDLTLMVALAIKGMGARKKFIVHIQTLGISPSCGRFANTCGLEDSLGRLKVENSWGGYHNELELFIYVFFPSKFPSHFLPCQGEELSLPTFSNI